MMQLGLLSPRQPLWLAGFRPFFTLAIIMGFLMPAIWGLVFSGKLELAPGINPTQWHAHEMLFGFAGSVLIGFLLTASKNWVKVRGIHGLSLMILVGLWIFERVFIYYASNCGVILKHLGMSLFFAASGFYIISTLLKHRQSASTGKTGRIAWALVFVVKQTLAKCKQFLRFSGHFCKISLQFIRHSGMETLRIEIWWNSNFFVNLFSYLPGG